MRVNATHWRVFLTQKLAILMKKQSRNELSLAPTVHDKNLSGCLQPVPSPAGGGGLGWGWLVAFLTPTPALPLA
ncbi:hypothetical protein SAMN02746062_01355 [Alysiella filiformis DSM 16848]|uniref:Uncharacterized protein n=1 Tax=Alysiella filiformis DSM 16848 TaxID=1120981 RepID=A0A286ECS9_9NEIS|nr:hypothetical protein SAMN02746062_01355 [Alysiella filiformis DSM 16848]